MGITKAECKRVALETLIQIAQGQQSEEQTSHSLAAASMLLNYSVPYSWSVPHSWSPPLPPPVDDTIGDAEGE
jgi:hypothetical protein